MMQIPPLQAIAEAGKVLVPGPILGVVSFAPILLLGAAKAFGLRTKVIKQRTASGAYSVALTTISRRAMKSVADQLPILVAASSFGAFALSLAILFASNPQKWRFSTWSSNSPFPWE
jgi:hypothetical protein